MLRTRRVSNGSSTVSDELRARLECAKEAVWVTTTDGRIVFWNRAAERSLGFGAREVCGRACADVLTGRDERGRALCGPACIVTGGITRKIPATFGCPNTRE